MAMQKNCFSLNLSKLFGIWYCFNKLITKKIETHWVKFLLGVSILLAFINTLAGQFGDMVLNAGTNTWMPCFLTKNNTMYYQTFQFGVSMEEMFCQRLEVQSTVVA